MPFKEHEEVEIDIRSRADVVIEGDGDALSFVGFIKSAPRGVPIAQDHDKYFDN